MREGQAFPDGPDSVLRDYKLRISDLGDRIFSSIFKKIFNVGENFRLGIKERFAAFS